MNRLAFLPTTHEDMRARDIGELDFVYIVGDAYVDHPSFGHAIISRVLERFGYSVGIIAQPDFHSTKDITRLGKPRLAFLVSAGNIDSMVNKYTVAKKKRGEDLYSPGGKAGLRPDRATSVYCRLIREAYPNAPIAIGGVEASLRRFAHYDYWSNSVRRSILFESRADILLYGMGERAIVELADALASGMDIKDVTYIDGTCYKAQTLDNVYDYIETPSFEDTRADKKRYAEAFMAQFREQDALRGKRLAQRHAKEGYLVANPPAKPLSTQELDDVYSLPYQRAWHPDYDSLGGVPALKEVKFSLTSCRGCFGGCSFCALTFHQGRVIQSRSHESLIEEAKKLTELPDFKGYIHDVGGPTADLRFPACKNQLKSGVCADKGRAEGRRQQEQIIPKQTHRGGAARRSEQPVHQQRAGRAVAPDQQTAERRPREERAGQQQQARALRHVLFRPFFHTSITCRILCGGTGKKTCYAGVFSASHAPQLA